MRIGIFVLKAGERGGGPETYEVGLLRALARLDHKNEYILYCLSEKARAVLGIEQDNFTYRILRPSLRPVSMSLTLPAMLIKDGVDFYHATVVPAPYSPKPLALTLHCFSNWERPDYYEPEVARRLNGLLRLGMRQSRSLLCVSDHIRQNIHTRFKLPLEKMFVTYHGVGEHFRPVDPVEARAFVAEKFGIREPYVFFMGQYQERKNVFRVIEAFARYRAEVREDVRLLLVGRNPDPSGPIYEAIVRNKVEPFVTRIRYVPNYELAPVFSGSLMFSFPSLYEGFGIPIIEAMACGTPVLTANTTCLPEVAGDAALLVNPESVEEITAAMVRIHREEPLRRDLVARGFRRASEFTWDNCARQTMTGYAPFFS